MMKTDENLERVSAHTFDIKPVVSSFVAEDDLSYFYFLENGGSRLIEIDESTNFSVNVIYQISDGLATFSNGAKLILNQAFYFALNFPGGENICRFEKGNTNIKCFQTSVNTVADAFYPYQK